MQGHTDRAYLVTPPNTVLDESVQLLQQAEQKLSQRRWHFQKLLNVDVDSAKNETVVADLEDSRTLRHQDLTGRMLREQYRSDRIIGQQVMTEL